MGSAPSCSLVLPAAPSLLPLKRPFSFSSPGRVILDPKFGVYIIYILLLQGNSLAYRCSMSPLFACVDSMQSIKRLTTFVAIDTLSRKPRSHCPVPVLQAYQAYPESIPVRGYTLDSRLSLGRLCLGSILRLSLSSYFMRPIRTPLLCWTIYSSRKIRGDVCNS